LGRGREYVGVKAGVIWERGEKELTEKRGGEPSSLGQFGSARRLEERKGKGDLKE